MILGEKEFINSLKLEKTKAKFGDNPLAITIKNNAKPDTVVF